MCKKISENGKKIVSIQCPIDLHYKHSFSYSSIYFLFALCMSPGAVKFH